MPTSRFNIPRLGFNTGPENLDALNQNIEIFDATANIVFVSVTTTTQPSNPAASSVYYIPIGASGAEWSANIGKVAVFRQTLGWHFFDAVEGLHGWIVNENRHKVFDGSAWIATDLRKRTSVMIQDPVNGMIVPMFRAVGNMTITRAHYDFTKDSTVGTAIDVAITLQKYVSFTSGATTIESSWFADVTGGYVSTSVDPVEITKLIQFTVNTVTGPVKTLTVTLEYTEDV